MTDLQNDLAKIIVRTSCDDSERIFLRKGLNSITCELKPYLYDKTGNWAGKKAELNAEEIIQKMQTNYDKIKEVLNPPLFSYARISTALHIAEIGLYALGTASYWMGSPLGGVPSSMAGGLAGQLA